MTLLLGATFPVLRPTGTSDVVTVVAALLALGVAFGLWRRLAHPLTLLRWATVGGTLVMTWGIVTTASGDAQDIALATRFLAYGAVLATLALFVFGTRRGLALALAVLGAWTLVVALSDARPALAAPDGSVFVALRYALVLLVLLWGVLRAHDVLEAEREALAAEARGERAARRARLEQEERRTQLLAEVAHELRAPLATIGAGADTLDEHGTELDPAMHRTVLDAIRHAADRLDRRTLELLDAAHDRFTDLPVQRREVDASAVAATTLDDLQPLTAEHDVRRDLHPTTPARLDPDGLDHILTNLVHNAVKYTPAGTVIEVRLHREVDTTVLVVADHGPGVPAGVRDELFTPWARDESHAEVDGSGVGLAVARSWARRHGGDLVLLDEGVGAVFEARLPDEG